VATTGFPGKWSQEFGAKWVLMALNESTCWTMIHAAASGDPVQREAFAQTYEPPIRAYLAARWKGSRNAAHIDDGVQAVFVECLRDGGVLSRASAQYDGGFRAFLYGTVRNIARRIESDSSRQQRHQSLNDTAAGDPPADETNLSHVFDRAWARRVMREAAIRQRESAAQLGSAAIERVELLRLRFEDGLPIREIARRWKRDAEWLHREYAKARKEFKDALLEVLALQMPGDAERVRRECVHLLGVLG